MTEPTDLTYVKTPVLEYFKLVGLNKYKSIGLHCEYGAKVVSAENGSGKTTLLNALYNLLTGKIARLLGLDFYEFVLKIANVPEIRAKKADLFLIPEPEFLAEVRQSPAGRRLVNHGLEDEEIVEMMLCLAVGDEGGYEASSGFHKLYDETPFDRDDVRRMCEPLITMWRSRTGIEEIQQRIKTALGGVSTLYLPTYRRIETDLPEFKRVGAIQKSRANRAKEEWDSDRLIFFGLQDVDRRLKNITSDIRKSTFEAYSRISGRTLDQLLTLGPSNPASIDANSEDIATLKLVLARLGKSNSETEARITELVTSGQINEASHENLRSFLSQLMEIYQDKRDAEQAIEAFASVVNRYWSMSSNEKEFRFDKLRVETEVVNNYTNATLPLEALSSGEKQIVSVFARLYLDPGKRYLILIDEPELSLSLEWQKAFLPDVLRAPSCEQLIAITHSPFVFENELDSYAGYLELQIGDPVR
jgi:predicted ATP-dependent endonuclease of OLD family